MYHCVDEVLVTKSWQSAIRTKVRAQLFSFPLNNRERAPASSLRRQLWPGRQQEQLWQQVLTHLNLGEDTEMTEKLDNVEKRAKYILPRVNVFLPAIVTS